MIFRFDNTYLGLISASDLSDVCYMIAHYHHFIDFAANQSSVIQTAVEQNASKTQKEEWEQFIVAQAYTLTDEVRKYLRTIVVDASWPVPRLKQLIERSGRLLIENDYEWDVYKKIIHIYAAEDRKYKYVFGLLQYARLHNLLVPMHCGGFSQMAILCIRHNADGEYKSIVEYKYMPIFDRDTTSAIIIDPNKNALITEFTGKSYSLFNQDNDLYVLDQPKYVWHMWYKRAIDLYFSNAHYRRLRIDVTQFPIDQLARDYIDPNHIHGYGKKNLPELSVGITYSEMESGLQHFTIRGENVSEMQLLLLKMLKII